MTISRFMMVAACLVAAAPAYATLSFTFTSPLQTGNPGDTLTYNVNLLNNDPFNSVDLNGSNPTLSAAGLNLNDLFLANTPPTLAPFGSAGDSFTGSLFTVDIAPGTPANTYFGTYQVIAQDSSGVDQSQTRNFQVAVTGPTPAPEPGALGMMAACLLAAGAASRKRLRKEPLSSE